MLHEHAMTAKRQGIFENCEMKPTDFEGNRGPCMYSTFWYNIPITQIGKSKILEFQPNMGKPANTCGKSCASSTCPMMVLRGQPLCIPCADGIKLQSLLSVRFWTSPVRNCLKYPAMGTKSCSNAFDRPKAPSGKVEIFTLICHNIFELTTACSIFHKHTKQMGTYISMECNAIIYRTGELIGLNES